MSRENSIQLIYQLSILIHNFLNYPVIELVYPNQMPGLSTAQWSIKMALLVISALLSSYSTLALPINATEMRSLKRSGMYSSFSRNFCILSKRMFQLLCHICSTYITIFLLMESERFVYFREYVSGKAGEDNLENFGFLIYGSIIFCIFPLLLILQNFAAVTVIVVGQSRKKARNILSRFGKTVRIRVRKLALLCLCQALQLLLISVKVPRQTKRHRVD